MLLPNLGYYPLGLFPARLLVISSIVSLIELVVATLAGALAVQGTGIGVGSSPYSRLVMNRNLRVQERHALHAFSLLTQTSKNPLPGNLHRAPGR